MRSENKFKVFSLFLVFKILKHLLYIINNPHGNQCIMNLVLYSISMDALKPLLRY